MVISQEDRAAQMNPYFICAILSSCADNENTRDEYYVAESMYGAV